MTWSKPTSEGGEPITGYVIEYRVKGTPTWIEDGRPTELAWSFTNFEVGESYEVRCAAFNEIGTGDYAQYPSPISIGGGKFIFAKNPNFWLHLDLLYTLYIRQEIKVDQRVPCVTGSFKLVCLI